MRERPVVVVGAGLGGLAAALHLAGDGRRVHVIERTDAPGGRAGQLRVDGYSFDTGPTVLTMPDVIDSTLAAVGETLTDWLDLVPLDPAYRAHFADGSTLDVRTDPDAMAAEIEALAGPREAAGYRDLARWLTRLYEVEFRSFIDRNIDSPLGLVGPDLARLVALGGLRRLSGRVAKHLRDPRTQKVFSFQTLYAGMAPHEALALYGVISYMDTVAGVWFPRGGMHALARALAGAAEKHGVEFTYGAPVTRIETRGGRATAVITSDGSRIEAQAVIVNADLGVAYRSLLPDRPAPRRLARARYAPSCLLLHVGADWSSPDLAHHNIHFGRAWRTTFDELVRGGVPQSDPSLLVCHPSGTDPALAPAGRHSYYVLVPAPHLGGRFDWAADGDRLVEATWAELAGRGYAGLRSSADVVRTVTPVDWAAMDLPMGTPFSLAHTFAQTGPFRPANRVRGLSNVFFAGAATHPGVGVPTVLISGRLAAERVRKA
ncbi:phytoene desaturase family protein [Luedemannella helvata]|uniref:Phytoene desaturase family protein n=1 Tax=Luedemannella helvata TaxID=349315 RepID=A0ABP4VRU0_9ACTN